MRPVVVAALVLVAITRMGMAKPDRNFRREPGFCRKDHIAGKAAQMVTRGQRGTGGGLLLGGDEGLSTRAAADFRKAGLSHITAASGYNVVVVSGWVMGTLARWLGRKRSIYFGTVCIILYMFLAGMTVPVIEQE